MMTQLMKYGKVLTVCTTRRIFDECISFKKMANIALNGLALAHDRIGKKICKILQADKFAFAQRPPGLILKKSIRPAPQRQIAEYKYNQQTRKQ